MPLFLAGLDGVVTIGVLLCKPPYSLLMLRKLTMFLVASNPNKKQRNPKGSLCFLAGLDGVEPSRRESKSRVLPLDYSPICDCLRILLYF